MTGPGQPRTCSHRDVLHDGKNWKIKPLTGPAIIQGNTINCICKFMCLFLTYLLSFYNTVCYRCKITELK